MSHDMTKPAKWLCAQQIRIRLGICPVWSECSLSAWRKLGSLATQWAHSKNWSDWADAQADLSSLGAHSVCWFCHVAAQIIPKLTSNTHLYLLYCDQNNPLVSWFQMNGVRWMCPVERLVSVQLAVAELTVNPVPTVAPRVVLNQATLSQVRQLNSL